MIPLRDDVPSRRVPAVMGLLIAANIVVFLGEVSLPPPRQEAVFYTFGLVPAAYFDVESGPEAQPVPSRIWPFVTHMFLHAGWLHLLSNMWFLWIFGDNVEDRMGHVLFLLFYLVCGLAAASTQLLLSRNSSVPMVGASGAVAGVLGAYVLLYPLARITVLLPILLYPLFFRVPALVFIVVWFGFQVYSGTQSLWKSGLAEGVAWWAHVGGFAAGMLMCPLLAQRRRQ